MTTGGSCRPGKATAMGLVPSIRSAPLSGATSLVELVIAPADQIALQGLERVVASHPEVIGIADADPARANRICLVHCQGIRLGADDQAEAILAIHRRGPRKFADHA